MDKQFFRDASRNYLCLLAFATRAVSELDESPHVADMHLVDVLSALEGEDLYWRRRAPSRWRWKTSLKAAARIPVGMAMRLMPTMAVIPARNLPKTVTG